MDNKPLKAQGSLNVKETYYFRGEGVAPLNYNDLLSLEINVERMDAQGIKYPLDPDVRSWWIHSRGGWDGLFSKNGDFQAAMVQLLDELFRKGELTEVAIKEVED